MNMAHIYPHIQKQWFFITGSFLKCLKLPELESQKQDAQTSDWSPSWVTEICMLEPSLLSLSECICKKLKVGAGCS